MKRRPLVEVTWIDSCLTSGWNHPTAADVSKCRTVGYLLKRGKRKVVVAMNVSSHGNGGEMMAIPTACVRKIRNLGRASS